MPEQGPETPYLIVARRDGSERHVPLPLTETVHLGSEEFVYSWSGNGPRQVDQFYRAMQDIITSRTRHWLLYGEVPMIVTPEMAHEVDASHSSANAALMDDIDRLIASIED